MKVRAAVPEDAAHFARIGAATFALACPPSTPRKDLDAYIASELSPVRFAQDIAGPAKRLFAAVLGQDVVGYLMLCREKAPATIRAKLPLELRRLYVLPEHHGSGVAAALLAEAIREAIAGANDALWLSVSIENHRGIAFYRKNGFTVVGDQQFTVGSDIHHDLLMCRRVGAQLGVPADRPRAERGR